MSIQMKIEGLRDVCAIDLEILKLRKHAKVLGEELAALEAKAVAAGEVAEGKKQALEALEASLKEQDEAIEAQKAKIAELEEKLGLQESTQVYMKMAGAIDEMKRKLESMTKAREDQDIELDGQRLEFEEASIGQTDSVKETTRLKSAKTREIKKNEDAIKARMEQRQAYAAKVESFLLATYERSSANGTRGGLAFVSDSGVCGGCNMKLRPQIQLRILAGEIGDCPTCHRMICAESLAPSSPSPIEMELLAPTTRAKKAKKSASSDEGSEE